MEGFQVISDTWNLFLFGKEANIMLLEFIVRTGMVSPSWFTDTGLPLDPEEGSEYTSAEILNLSLQNVENGLTTLAEHQKLSGLLGSQSDENVFH
jgi:hypothetical protein